MLIHNERRELHCSETDLLIKNAYFSRSLSVFFRPNGFIRGEVWQDVTCSF